MEPNNTLSPDFRCGYVAIIGEPNVGKSTLLNTLIGQKIAIVTPKPQTTRHRIVGIHSSSDHQVVFLDTPGMISPRYRLQEVMMHSAGAAVGDADLLVLTVDVTRPPEGGGDTDLFHRLEKANKATFLVINKIDLVSKGSLLPLMQAYAARYPFREIFPVSALKADGTAELLTKIVEQLPRHPPFFPLDIVSEQTDRFFAGEIIREKVFQECEQEIPYSTAVDIVEFEERDGAKWLITADIYVERDSQRAILIGKGGAMLKTIGTSARKDIEAFLGHPVFLRLYVKVRARWRKEEKWLRRFGYGD